MSATPDDWRVQVHKGDKLSITATYDSARATWYEGMGIMVVWMAAGDDGTDPFQKNVDVPGVLTHGHLPENDNHGGADSRSRALRRHDEAAVEDAARRLRDPDRATSCTPAAT